MKQQPLAPPDLVLVRYGELALKGANRKGFERALVRNLRFAVKPISPVRIDRGSGRITITPERRTAAVARRVQQVFGVKSASPAWSCGAEPGELETLAVEVFGRAAEELPNGGKGSTFRVRTRRADKAFPIGSEAFDRRVGMAIGQRFPALGLELRGPDLELGIEIRDGRGRVFVDQLDGPGGLPVGTLGRALCLLSGGIDSPVASWLAMKRGLEVSYCYFHSEAWVGPAARKKVQDIVRALEPWQPTSRLFVVDLTPVQELLRAGAPERYLTILQRRSMTRIAEHIAGKLDFGALVTGDCLGQVASQTLENLACIEAAASTLPVLRPLVGFDKEETIALARRIGTLEASLVDAPDCCTVFQPERPQLRGRLFDCLRIEEELGPLLGELEESCAAGFAHWKPEATEVGTA